MSRSLSAILLFSCVLAVHAQETPAPAGDLHTLRQLVEQQSKQIEMLTQQVARLTQLLENGRPEAAAAAPQNMPPAQETNAAPAVEAPKAEAVPAPEGSSQHVVAKGETLISIAKHYKISVAELLKVNKIEDERKLQIGQTLIIPPNKPVESPKQNKL